MYILMCNDNSFYVGSTWDLDTRIAQHVEGFGCEYTSKRKPVKLLYAELYDRRDEAWQREKQIQGWGRAKRTALIEGRLGDLPGLSRSKSADNGEHRGRSRQARPE
jgi:putative endonuclease